MADFKPPKTITVEVPYPSNPEAIIDHLINNARFESMLGSRLGDHPAAKSFADLAVVYLALSDAIRVPVDAYFNEAQAEREREQS